MRVTPNRLFTIASKRGRGGNLGGNDGGEGLLWILEFRFLPRGIPNFRIFVFDNFDVCTYFLFLTLVWMIEILKIDV